MKIRKAVITAAGPSQRSLPLQTLIDRDGVEKPVLRIIVEEALRAGVDEIAIVVSPGDEIPYARVAGDHAGRLRFVPQPEPLGYGHAVLCARDFVRQDPFLHLVGDHLYISRTEKGCAQQLVEVAEAQACAVSAVPPVVGRYHGTGRTTRNGSQFPNGNALVRGLWPYPTMTVPSAETPSSSTRATHLSAVWTPAACNNILRSCIPVLAVQTKQ